MIARTPREALFAGGAAVVAVALVLAASGALLLAAGALVVPVVGAAWVWMQARRYSAQLGQPAPTVFTRGWRWGAALAVAAAALLVLVITSHNADLASCSASCGGGNLVTVFHWREPVGAIVAAVLAVFGAVAVVVIGAESESEREHAAQIDEKVKKQERIERRRADREAARRKTEVSPQ